MKRWTRYGHDRLYVQTQTGERLGYWDCKTGTAVVQPGADRDAFDTALVGHLPTRRAGGLGPSAEYLRRTALACAELGIHDRHLWSLQALVAERLRAGASGGLIARSA